MKRDVYVADFETTTRTNQTRVWCWAVSNLDGVICAQGLSIDSFMEWATTGKPKDVWFHNLKFDGEFIVSYLLNNQWNHVQTKKIMDNQFKTLVDGMGTWYGLTVCKGTTRKRVTVDFYDSAKKLLGTVRSIAKRFHLDVSKGDIDYHAIRPIGYVPTDEEWDYVHRDVIIVAKALNILFQQGLTKMTTSSDALHSYKQTLAKNQYANLFPKLTAMQDALARRAYKGGYVFVNPMYQYDHLTGLNYDTGSGATYDINSLYPYVMLDKVLPFGKPRHFVGQYVDDEEYPLYIQVLKVDLQLKPNHFPTVQTKGSIRNTNDKYIIDTEEPIILTMNSIDLELMFKHYEVEVYEWKGGLKFQAAKGMFDDYLSYWREKKENSTGGERESAKLMMNSLYGKFGMNPLRTSKSPTLQNGIVKWKQNEPTLEDANYVPVASFITSWARKHTIDTAQANYTKVAYIDTDSMHIIGDPTSVHIDIHPTRFGAWKHENDFTQSRYIRPKTYIEVEEHHTLVKCAGMPDASKKYVTFENFVCGSSFAGKLLSRRVEGGVVLYEDKFTIKLQS